MSDFRLFVLTVCNCDAEQISWVYTVSQWWCLSNKWRLSLLQRAQRHWGTSLETKAKARIKRLSECGVKGVEVDHCVRRDFVEGQSASRTVHIHCYLVRDRGGGDDGCSTVIVPDIVTTTIWADQSPGQIILSKHTVITVSFPSNSSVGHRYRNSSSPFNLPVTATSKYSCAQQLRTGVKSVWMIRKQLILPQICHFPVVVRHFDISVYCVCVNCKFTGIWGREQDTIWLQLLICHLLIYFMTVWSWHQRVEWVMSQFEDGGMCASLFWVTSWETHLHFLRPGVNHWTPPGSILKEGGVRCAHHLACKDFHYITRIHIITICAHSSALIRGEFQVFVWCTSLIKCDFMWPTEPMFVRFNFWWIVLAAWSELAGFLKFYHANIQNLRISN